MTGFLSRKIGKNSIASKGEESSLRPCNEKSVESVYVAASKYKIQSAKNNQ